ncbi:hypothetical protein Btru_071115 [Bulinus truncatus]|nr:hypothetical protein Btru_071115 [Bulinus truncatus]
MIHILQVFFKEETEFYHRVEMTLKCPSYAHTHQRSNDGPLNQHEPETEKDKNIKSIVYFISKFITCKNVFLPHCDIALF